MPSTFDYRGDKKRLILIDLYNIVLKDTIQRNNVKNVDLLDRIMRFVMYNISQPFFANKIYKRLKRIFYIQVSYLLAIKKTIEREFNH